MGAAMGVLSGIGVGGGKLLVPALVFFFAVEQRRAQGVALMAFLPIACVAGCVHRQEGVVDWGAAAWLVCGSVVGAVLGAWGAAYVTSKMLQRLYGAFLAVVAVYEMFSRQGISDED